VTSNSKLDKYNYTRRFKKMAYTHISRITTLSDQVFETADEFILFHGTIGNNNPLVEDFSAEIEEGGTSIIRTMVYNTLGDREAHKIEGGFDSEDDDDSVFTPEGKQYSVILISISE
jgi:hypothetical protein